jgi:hypothetical protein
VLLDVFSFVEEVIILILHALAAHLNFTKVRLCPQLNPKMALFALEDLPIRVAYAGTHGR